jgi:hypothetical protein
VTDHRRHIDMVPEHCRDGLLGYIEHGHPVGDFLTALLSNNLKETFACADDVNAQHVRDYVDFLYNYAPAQCWGSKEAVEAWQLRGGINRRNAG